MHLKKIIKITIKRIHEYVNCFERDQNLPKAVNKHRKSIASNGSINPMGVWPNARAVMLMRTRNLGHIYRGCPVGFFNPVIPTGNFEQSRNSVILRVIFGIPPPAHTFNPESRPDLL